VLGEHNLQDYKKLIFNQKRSRGK